jgi:hypothetical protein
MMALEGVPHPHDGYLLAPIMHITAKDLKYLLPADVFILQPDKRRK